MDHHPNFRCDTCKSTSEDPRNLVVFIDGTSNKFGPENTNVVKLFRQVDTESEGSTLKQFKNYWSGIGTQSESVLDHMGNKVNRLIEMAFAWNVENNVKDAYGWLVDKYEKGAQIYLFGFSRGAYQVRVLAGLIHEVRFWSICHITVSQVYRACDRYRCIHTNKPKAREMATDFKKAFCWQDVRIHFVGVWDTVSSVGLFKRDAFVSASVSMTNACYFRHALALDERRVKFMPEYFVEMNVHPNEKGNGTVNDHAEEVWFAGSHSDVHYLFHAGHVPLLWMRREASAKGLILNPEDITWIPDDVSHGRVDSMKAAWWPFEVVPTRHQVSFSGTGEHKWR
ncbi:hypothetical protein HD554DRAFT_2020868 [Boletus coccyginus]|nr:hypothetical protein HD554DRAFT_2020868 [Boletus coccyginus]